MLLMLMGLLLLLLLLLTGVSHLRTAGGKGCYVSVVRVNRWNHSGCSRTGVGHQRRT